MHSRREFLEKLSTKAIAAGAALKLASPNALQAAQKNQRIILNPYTWSGPYARMRTAKHIPHDVGLCAEIWAAWMMENERLVLRSSEMIGYKTEYFYDDHIPPDDPEGRGKNYQHIAFHWNPQMDHHTLSADCVVPNKAKFWLRLQGREDVVDVELGLRNDLAASIGEIDWAFCVVGFDSPSLGDASLERTYLFDGTRLRSLRELSGAAKSEIYGVAGEPKFIPKAFRNHARGKAEAKTSVVIVESVDGKHSAGLGFPRSYQIFSNPSNKCFHADPYFPPFTKQGETHSVRGKLYLIEGKAQDVLTRYMHDFGV